MIMKKRIFIAAIAMMAVVFTSCEDKKKEQEEKEKMEQMEAEKQAEMDAQKEQMEMESNSIAAKAIATDTLSTLVSALKSADLATFFTVSEGPFTVFAPHNAAFAELDDATLESLMRPENQSTLGDILKYHVVEDEVTSEELVQLIQDNDGKFVINTMAGADLVASIKDGNVILTDGAGNEITVVQVDVDASNGVVHIIDGVLMKNAS